MAGRNPGYPKKQPQSPDIDAIGVEIGRKPPQAIDIEEAVLGALMLEQNVVPEVMDLLIPECFYKEANRKIFNAIKTLSDNHNPIDIYTVADQLSSTGDLDSVGGAYYLSQLTNRIGAAAHVEYHSKVLLQKYIQRELISISYEVQKNAFDDTLSVDELLDSTQQKIFSIAERNIRKEIMPIHDLVNATIDEIEQAQKNTEGVSGIPSGFPSLDAVTLGWQKADLVIIAARPSMGKTALVLNMARNMAVDHQVPVAFFSLEMSAESLMKRLMVSETGISSTKIRGGQKMTEEDWKNLNDRISAISNSPLWVDDTGALSLYEFRSKARRLVRNQGVKIIMLDYLQLMTVPSNAQGTREQEVSTISRSLKAIAKELNVPIIALSQLSRKSETRGGSMRPQLSDLRESGAIEQDADLVIFIHRPEYYGLQDAVHGEAQIIIAKHRNGAVKDIKMQFIDSEVKFVDNGDMNSDDNFEIAESSMNSGSFDDGFQPGTGFDTPV
jgi:replicative DNA helicase